MRETKRLPDAELAVMQEVWSAPERPVPSAWVTERVRRESYSVPEQAAGRQRSPTTHRPLSPDTVGAEQRTGARWAAAPPKWSD